MSPLKNNIQLFLRGLQKVLPITVMVDSLDILVIGNFVIDVELEVGRREWSSTGALYHDPIPGAHRVPLPRPWPQLLPDVDPVKARTLRGRLDNTHHGVRRHRLELRGFGGDLALVEAAGGEGNVEKLDVAVIRLSERHFCPRHWEGEGLGPLSGHPSVELRVVLVPLEAVQGLPLQLIVTLQLHWLRNLKVIMAISYQ